MKHSMIAMAVSGALMAAAQGAESAGGNGSKTPAKVKFSKREIDLDAGTVSFVFGDDGEDVVVNPSEEFPEEVQKRLLLHGTSQKGGDSFAGVKGNFKLARSNLLEVLDELRAGNWRSSGDERPRLGELAAAISRIKGLDLEKTKAAVEKASDEQRKNWRANAGVKAEIAKIRAENAAQQLEAAGPQEIEISLEEATQPQ